MPSKNTRVSRHSRKGTKGVKAHDREVNVPIVPHGDIRITKTQQTRLKRLKNRLAKATAGDKGHANNVAMIAVNDRDFYKDHVQPMITMQVRKKKKGILKKDMAMLGWTNKVKYAIDSYNDAMDVEGHQREMFTPETKAEIAKQLNEHYYSDIKRGNYD
jgi:hypothetical protein